MKYYTRKETSEVFAFESDGSQDSLIPDDLVPMADAEVDEFFSPKYYTDGTSVVQATAAIPDWVLATPEQVEAYEARQVIDHAVVEVTRLRAKADAAIATLQDAVELGRADQAKQDLLKAWKNYRLDLVEVPEQEGYPTDIDWPALPA